MGNRLSKIYTRTGDDGTTGLANGERVAKADSRVAAFGDVDETNSAIGLLLTEPDVPPAIRASLARIQHELFEVGAQATKPPRGSVGLYHLAWEIDTIEALAEMADRLRELGAMTGASDHGVSKSLYGRDLDGNEFEVMWQVPRAAWGEYERQATVMPLDLEAELKRWGASAAVQ